MLERICPKQFIIFINIFHSIKKQKQKHEKGVKLGILGIQEGLWNEILFNVDSISSSEEHQTLLKSYNVVPDADVYVNDADNDGLTEQIIDPNDLFSGMKFRGELFEIKT